jgi:GT2 family glycosyltransferase
VQTDRAGASAASEAAVIGIVVLTHNRVHLLQRCVENVLFRTSVATGQIVVWNNGSDDGTFEYLDALDDPRLKVVHHFENIGQNAYARAFKLLTAPYLVLVDDDVIDAPEGWDRTLLEAYLGLRGIGYLAASLADDPNDAASQYVKYMREVRNAYVAKSEAGVRILEGPVGGGCALTSRAVFDHVGGFREHRKYAYWHAVASFVTAVRKHGYRTAWLQELEVWHAGGPHYADPPQPKREFHHRNLARRARRNALKRAILRLPLAARINERFGWFEPPHDYAEYLEMRSDRT